MMEVLNDILGYEDRKIYQDDKCFSFSLDSVMLANFVDIRLSDSNIVDLGTGNGVIPLILSMRTNKKIIGVEIQEKLSNLAKKSVLYNKLDDQIEIINLDMKDYVKPELISKFDIVTCNPPYFKIQEKSLVNKDMEKLIARHEIAITLNDIFSISKKLLKDGGKLAIVHRADRLIEILNEFEQNNIVPKRLQFVYESVDKDAIIVLIEGIKHGKSGLRVESPFILHNNDGTNTEQYSKFLSEVRK